MLYYVPKRLFRKQAFREAKMKFYDRQREIELLKEIAAKSRRTAQFTVITGRRRIGKTSLVRKAFERQPYLHFIATRKSEAELCEGFQSEITDKLGVPLLGESKRFADVFRFVMDYAKKHPTTLFIDEFQEFFRVNPSIYGDIQGIWDVNKDKAKINLIVGGSVYTLMTKIFRDKKEPLFGRQTHTLSVEPFSVSVLKQILRDHKPKCTNEDLLALWTFTGGVAKYVELLMDDDATSRDKMIRTMIAEDSSFITEGKSMLIEEFGKDYGNYFSILALIARGKTTRNEIESAIGKEVGGYLTKLEDEFSLIAKHQPLFEKTARKNVRYRLSDNFLVFWFRFLHRFSYMTDIKAYRQLQDIVKRDYDVFSGFALESYFRSKLIESGSFTRLGGWWDRKGENEIDLIAENEIDKRAVFIEIKRQPSRYSESSLKAKVDVFLKSTGRFKDYKVSVKGLSLVDM